MKHPEQREGEVFIGNIEPQRMNVVGWTTKRKGDTAYDVNGIAVKELVPVFVQESEIRAKIQQYEDAGVHVAAKPLRELLAEAN